MILSHRVFPSHYAALSFIFQTPVVSSRCLFESSNVVLSSSQSIFPDPSNHRQLRLFYHILASYF